MEDKSKLADVAYVNAAIKKISEKSKLEVILARKGALRELLANPLYKVKFDKKTKKYVVSFIKETKG